MVYHSYCSFDFLNAKTAVWFSQIEQNQIAFFVWCKEAKAKHVDILLLNTTLFLHIIVKINDLDSFWLLKTTDSQWFFVLLQLTFVSLSRHIRKRRALLILALYSQILAKFEYRNRQVATTLTLRIYTIPKGITIYSLCVSGYCLLISVGNARSLTVE